MPLNEATSLLFSFYFISIILFIHITVRYMYDEFWLKQLIDNMQSNVKMKYMYKSYPFYKTNISLQPSEWLGPIVILYLSPKLNNYLHFKHDLPVG